MAGKSKLLKKKRLILEKNRLLRRISNNKNSRVVNAETSSGCVEQEKPATTAHIKNENEDIIADKIMSGPDVDSNIPNRIPVFSYTNCDTSDCVRADPVLTVTVYEGDSQEISERAVEDDPLTIELLRKALTSSPGPSLPRKLQGSTYYESHVAFRNAQTVKEEWYNNIVNGNYDTAVNMAQNFGATDGEFINETVTRLISSAPRNVMCLAYKLWQAGAKDMVRNYFPQSFQHIFNEDAVTIVNMQYQQPLKLDVHTNSSNDSLAWGNNNQCKITRERVSWKLLPVWNRDGVTFKLYNTHRNMYLKLDVNVNIIGERQVRGSTKSDKVKHRYYLEPLVKNRRLVFLIITCQYGQGLKLDVKTNKIGDRLVWSHNGNMHNDEECFMWDIKAW